MFIQCVDLQVLRQSDINCLHTDTYQRTKKCTCLLHILLAKDPHSLNTLFVNNLELVINNGDKRIVNRNTSCSFRVCVTFFLSRAKKKFMSFHNDLL